MGEYIARFGETGGGIYIDVLKNRKEYCLWILARPAMRNEFTADPQSYVRGRIARYDFPIWLDPTNDEGQ